VGRADARRYRLVLDVLTVVSRYRGSTWLENRMFISRSAAQQDQRPPCARESRWA
jgi:hypothetical protein